MTARVGIALGVAITVCFATGLISHLIQHPVPWFAWPTRPAWLYRFTQGAHVITGIAAIPLVIVKLWAVWPKLFERPVFGGLTRQFERLSILVHVAVKLPVVRRALGEPLDDVAAGGSIGPTRRAVLRGTWLAVGVATLATAGQTIPLVRQVSVLAPRSGAGPQGLPVNRTAIAAGVLRRAYAPDYRLTVVGGATSRSFTIAELSALPQVTHRLPIACVEGWSADADWTGVVLADLLAAAGAAPDRDLRMVSLEPPGPYSRTVLPAAHARDRMTLIALRVNGEPLHADHGYPCRLIAPSRPGVLQTKWLSRIEVIP
ncbi:molybdopterin-dependent oxidoreductase [Mycolicibacterium sp. J2]|uniref:molybdopterin-dependent oxidoreductase n=1 Tax=Mycolicibacterium sp. J2 TaxID=2993511 RepID=UPI00224AA36D|nr:molybdopterin-dependent oxidoreductase [Mycolicibacterium sp. J2]MCX2710932.1 molybdopterin-dependent oxidoreductase [Mycolicibacterium sp. J2]